MPDRIKGQESSITVTSTTQGVEPAFGDVKSWEFQYDREILKEGYIGQTTDQADDIYKGISGNIEFHERTAEIHNLLDRINYVSQRRLPGESFTIVITERFPVGGTRRITIPNCKFGNIPISAGSRQDFVSFKLDFAADSATVLATPV